MCNFAGRLPAIRATPQKRLSRERCQAEGGVGFDGEDGNFELFAAMGQVDRDGCEGSRAGLEPARQPDSGGVRRRGDGFNKLSLHFPNGSRIVGLPGTEATIRGFSAVSLILIDEAARVSDAMYKALRPMLAVGNGDLWMMSTPYGKRGFFWETWALGGEEWERIFAPATECERISGDFLERERRMMGPRMFGQEFMGEFMDNGGHWFSRDAVERALRDEEVLRF